MVIGPVTTAGAGLPSNGAVLQLSHPRLLDMGQQRLACLGGEASHRLSTSGACDDLLVAWHRHLRYSIVVGRYPTL
jgi:hypothetical protein